MTSAAKSTTARAEQVPPTSFRTTTPVGPSSRRSRRPRPSPPARPRTIWVRLSARVQTHNPPHSLGAQQETNTPGGPRRPPGPFLVNGMRGHVVSWLLLVRDMRPGATARCTSAARRSSARPAPRCASSNSSITAAPSQGTRAKRARRLAGPRSSGSRSHGSATSVGTRESSKGLALRRVRIHLCSEHQSSQQPP